MTSFGFMTGPPGFPAGRDVSPPPDQDDPFEMANLHPRSTGLPMTVWVSPRGNARHDARVKVSRQGGDRMVIEDAAVVAIRPEPTLLAGHLDPQDLGAVRAWILLNQAALIAYWDGELDTVELVMRLQRV
ncbi:DUF4160 domain-containing protein [Falsiroseomonas sp. CW058]|uniref:DUF4160 domain-containing protein n=1 Tax=Falsiroseomonas sp. CW058 TaxID=3388664 RepID=UPI003D324521